MRAAFRHSPDVVFVPVAPGALHRAIGGRVVRVRHQVEGCIVDLDFAVCTEGGGHSDGCLCERGMCGLKART